MDQWVISIDGCIPNTQTKGEQPNCDFNACSSPADFTITFGNENGYGLVHRCRAHLEMRVSTVSAQYWDHAIKKFLALSGNEILTLQK
jgi:hypothetical protein